MNGLNSTANDRLATVRQLLEQERRDVIMRVRRLRLEQEEDAAGAQGDELDTARSLAEVETHAGMIDQHETRLRAIEAAIGRIDTGDYGICLDCGEEIPIERLRVMPAALRCVDCQRKHNTRGGRGTLDRDFARRWAVPEEVNESMEGGDERTLPEDSLIVRDRGSFGPEEGEFEQMPPAPTAGRRGRVKKRL